MKPLDSPSTQVPSEGITLLDFFEAAPTDLFSYLDQISIANVRVSSPALREYVDIRAIPLKMSPFLPKDDAGNTVAIPHEKCTPSTMLALNYYIDLANTEHKTWNLKATGRLLTDTISAMHTQCLVQNHISDRWNRSYRISNQTQRYLTSQNQKLAIMVLEDFGAKHRLTPRRI